MRKSGFTILFVVIACNLLIWALLNRSVAERPWSGIINGVSFSPSAANENPLKGEFPTDAEIDSALKFLKGKVARVRLYSSLDGMQDVPRLAEKYGLHVTAAAWIDRRLDRNERDIAELVANARRYPNIDRVLVGNESVLRGDVTVQQLIGYIRRVRQQVRQPVSTAEPWHVWLKYPQLAHEVDFIAIHVLPYWEGLPVDQSVNYVMKRYEEVRDAYPDKHVVISEVGWPSAGDRRGAAKPSLVNESQFIRQFLNVAQEKGLDYNIMEAFDQPWKTAIEGSVGPHWGLFTVDHKMKFPMVGPVTEVPIWPVQVLAATLLAFVPLLIFLLRWRDLRTPGRLFFAFLLQLSASLLVWTGFTPAVADLSLWGKVIWAILLPSQIALVVVLLVNGLEMVEMIWPGRFRRHFPPVEPAPGARLPKVSLHLAICNEPPEMVKETLNSLAALDYPDYEVLVIDNNTADPALWEPVRDHCGSLGSRFRFFHLPKWPGFKAGALNFGLKQMDPAAEVFGVIDSDYVVRPDWLRTTVPYFQDAKVGFVQAPQDNREWGDDLFKEMINWEYAGFFAIGMVQRNERNAIIPHGTMPLVRVEAMAKLGGWAEWTICEDAETGLRLFEEGYEAVYVNEPYGRGLVPDSFQGYKKQRFRWAYGAMQIMKGHWKELTVGRRLTFGQKYHFITGWLPWIADAMYVVFTVASILWSIGLIAFPQYFTFPPVAFLLPTIGVFCFKVIHSLWLYQARLKCSWGQRLGAAVAGMALTHTIAKAVIQGLSPKKVPFMRTPKCENRPALLRGLMMASEETAILAGLWLSIIGVIAVYPARTPEVALWVAVIAVQSIPYLAALATSLVNSVPAFQRRGRVAAASLATAEPK